MICGGHSPPAAHGSRLDPGHRGGLQYSYDTEKRTAMAAWARHVEQLVSGEAAANGVPEE
jgi:hypothetical protein